jgi:glycosyltransferase involved in cell wall biosynthesis
MKDPVTRMMHQRYIQNADKSKWCWDYKVSIVIPTRGRVELLKDCLLSILDKSFKRERLFEIILVIDYDDDETLNFVREFSDRFKFNCGRTKMSLNSLSVILTERSEYMQRDYNNAGANAAKGDLIFILNDDCIITTTDWDKKLVDYYIENKPDDDIMLIACSDNTHDDERIDPNTGKVRTNEDYGSCFPIFTKTFCEIFHGVIPPEVRMWSADTIMNHFFRIIYRKFSFPDLHVDHISYHSDARDQDEINRYVKDIIEKDSLLTATRTDFKPYLIKIKNLLNDNTN